MQSNKLHVDMCCLKINTIYAAVTLTFEVALQVIYASQTTCTKVGVSSCLSFSNYDCWQKS